MNFGVIALLFVRFFFLGCSASLRSRANPDKKWYGAVQTLFYIAYLHFFCIGLLLFIRQDKHRVRLECWNGLALLQKVRVGPRMGSRKTHRVVLSTVDSGYAFRRGRCLWLLCEATPLCWSIRTSPWFWCLRERTGQIQQSDRFSSNLKALWCMSAVTDAHRFAAGKYWHVELRAFPRNFQNSKGARESEHSQWSPGINFFPFRPFGLAFCLASRFAWRAIFFPLEF